MARPCYIYNLLKLPGLEGIITVRGNLKKARECEEGAAAFAEAMLHAEEYQEIKEAMSPSEMPATKSDVLKPSPQFKASEETKKISLDESDPSKVTSIGIELDNA